MKPTYLVTLMLVAAIVGAGAYALRQMEATESVAGNIPSASSPAPEPVISTAHPVRRPFALQIHWIGSVESQAAVELTARMAGRVEAIDAEDQHPVRMGQPVIQLGGPQIEDARAKLRAQIDALKEQAQLTRETLARLEESLRTRLATKDQVAAAREAKVRLEGQLREAQLNLKIFNRQSHMSAPMSGIFTNRRVSVGQEVAAGQVVGDLIDTDRLRVRASLFPPRNLALQGREAVVRLDDDQTVAGTVRQVLPEASGTGAETVWIEGPQINAHLHPGQTVGGKIVAESRSGALAVPTSAIVYDDQDHPYVFVRQDGAYERLGIRTGMEQDGWVEVLSGLKEDQVVVDRGAYELFYRQFNEQFKVQD